jgi:ribosomal protein S18 acetylase RimI-like enzyme
MNAVGNTHIETLFRKIISTAYPKVAGQTPLPKQDFNTLVLIENEMIIGTASFCKSRWEKFSEYGEIVSIYFLPDYIGKGYGNHLLRKCIEELNLLGFTKLLLWVLEDNWSARRFYEKNGFWCSNEYMTDNIGGKDLREIMYTFPVQNSDLQH